MQYDVPKTRMARNGPVVTVNERDALNDKQERRKPSQFGIRDRQVSRAADYGLDGGGKFYLFSTTPKLFLGSTQPPIECVSTTISLELMELGRVPLHSHPSSVEVMKGHQMCHMSSCVLFT
jgi:hypothetical protein